MVHEKFTSLIRENRYVYVMSIEAHAFFHALSDPTRLRCLALLHAEGNLCVCDLTRALGLSQPKISRHLALLRDLRIVTARREGVWMHYHLAPQLAGWMRAVLDQAMPAFRQSPQGQADWRALHGECGSCSNHPEE